eukprot:gb/GECG01014372.1/.p1 GENE.gb/GECG01014372.1/~~gb/GECG01014372.1/.p1  ORF type:complete len:542 (+),score=50.04 gb/GECG01014372.1/:1-1626(+)
MDTSRMLASSGDEEPSRLYQASLQKAFFHCYYNGRGDLPKLKKIPPIFLRYELESVEQAYREWQGAKTSYTTMRGLIAVIVCLGLYYWSTDWFELIVYGGSEAVKRLVSRGSMVLVGVALYPSFNVLGKLSTRVVYVLRLMASNALCLLLLWRIYLEDRYVLFVRSTAIWSVFLKVLVLLVGQPPSHYFGAFNLFDFVAHLVLHHLFRPMSLDSIVPWELSAMATLQVYCYLMELQSREEFTSSVLSWLHGEVCEEINKVYSFVESYTCNAVTLLKMDSSGIYRFHFISASIQKLLGWQARDLLNYRLRDFVAEWDRDYVDHILSSFMSTSRIEYDSHGSPKKTDELVWNLPQKKSSLEGRWNRTLHIHRHIASLTAGSDSLLWAPRAAKPTEGHARVAPDPTSGSHEELSASSRSDVTEDAGPNAGESTREIPTPGRLAVAEELHASNEGNTEVKDTGRRMCQEDLPEDPGTEVPCSECIRCSMYVKDGKTASVYISFRRSAGDIIVNGEWLITHLWELATEYSRYLLRYLVHVLAVFVP